MARSNWMRGVVALVLLIASSPVGAQTQAEFYKDKAVDLYIWTSVGGAYDTYSRLLARHLGKYVAGNPRIHIPPKVSSNTTGRVTSGTSALRG